MYMQKPFDPNMLPVLLPVIILGLGLMIYCLLDLTRPERRVRGGDKRFWAVVIVLGNMLGQIIYLFYGREEE